MRPPRQFASDMETYIEQHGLEKYRGRIMPRNSHRSPWATVLDLRFAQELPIFRKTRGILTLDIENFANMLNKDWGQLRQVGFPYCHAGRRRGSHHVRPAAPMARRAATSTGRAPDRAGPVAPFEHDFLVAVGLARPAGLPHRVLIERHLDSIDGHESGC